jgi:hypothetical protein
MQIREIRVSFTWFELLPELAADGSKGLLPFFHSNAAWKAEFDTASKETVRLVQDWCARNPPSGSPEERAEWRKRMAAELVIPRSAPGGVTPPWPFYEPNHRHWFWWYFLQEDPRYTTGERAWAHLIPFRTGFESSIRSTQPGTRVQLDGFLYPHGIGLMITLRLRLGDPDDPYAAGVTLPRAVKRVLSARADPIFQVERGGTTETRTLDVLAAKFLGDLRSRVTDSKTPGKQSERPFSVATVVRGEGVDVNQAVAEGGDIHHALQALCGFRSTWQDDQLRPLAKAAIRLRASSPASHMMYRFGNGRAVWFPALFQDRRRVQRTAGCYHRNLALLHLQADALTGMVSLLPPAGDKTPVPADIEMLAAASSILLGRLYASDFQTYRSSSARAWIDDNPPVKDRVNAARKLFEQGELAWTASDT